MNLKLVDKKSETSDVTSFFFEPVEKIPYQAGQYLKYTLLHIPPDNRGQNRYFTVASSPREPYIMLSTKFAPEKGSSFKKALQLMQIGQIIQAEGPFGEFTWQRANGQPVVWIAGGIGITPFRAMLMDHSFKNVDPNITLFYANRTEDIPFKGLFDQYLQNHHNFKLIYVVEQPSSSWTGQTGKITPDLIKRFVPTISSTEPPFCYVSGPEPMVEAFGDMLKNIGLPKDKFKQDFFPGYTD